MTKPVAGTAADVRNYFQARESRMARLSPEAQATVRPGARGKIHAEAVSANNARRSPKHQYVTGASQVAAKAEAEAAHALRVQAAKALGSVGSRGPLPKAFLAQSKG